MTSKRFSIILIAVLIIGTTYQYFWYAILNLYYDPFGLWHSHEEKKIYQNERTTKYLMSLRYVPENFDGILTGPSVSANLDTRRLKTHKIYNLSINGGNVTEINHTSKNYIQKTRNKIIIICLYPYMTKDSGFKDNQFTYKNLLDAAIFSPFAIAVTRKIYNHIPPRMGFEQSEWGWNNFDLKKMKRGIKFYDYYKIIIKTKKIIIKINAEAYDELGNLITLCRQKNFTILAYFYPINHWEYQSFVRTGSWDTYKKKMFALFSPNDIVWDMNTEQYEYITKNFDAYTDGHLSQLGANFVLEDIDRKLQSLQ
ncbi:MAG: hypothetical protein C4522_20560 [Desulfobacteraceae bacterium]|nr:MAG: hypothetical protein C4522_20560 [Desulfobacteraceae bacterium]